MSSLGKQVFMLVDAGRLDRSVVSKWKESPESVPEHSANTMPESTVVECAHHASPPTELYHTIPYPPAPGVPLHHNMHDSLYYTRPPPPTGAYQAPMPYGHLPPELMMPPTMYHADQANINMATNHADFSHHQT